MTVGDSFVLIDIDLISSVSVDTHDSATTNVTVIYDVFVG